MSAHAPLSLISPHSSILQTLSPLEQLCEKPFEGVGIQPKIVDQVAYLCICNITSRAGGTTSHLCAEWVQGHSCTWTAMEPGPGIWGAERRGGFMTTSEG